MFKICQQKNAEHDNMTKMPEIAKNIENIENDENAQNKC